MKGSVEPHGMHVHATVLVAGGEAAGDGVDGGEGGADAIQLMCQLRDAATLVVMPAV